MNSDNSSTTDSAVASRFSAAARKLETADFAATRTTFVELRAHERFHERCCNALVHIDLQLDQRERALQTLDELVERYPKTLDYPVSYAALAQSPQELNAAATKLEEFLALEQGNAEAYVQLAQVQRQQGQHRLALGSLTSALTLAVANPQDALVSVAVIHADLAEHDLALAALDRAIRIVPSHYPALFNRASMLEETGDAAGAKLAYEAVISRYPQALSARVRLAEMGEATASKLAELDALAAGADLLRQQPDARIELEFARGHIADQLGEYARAWQHFSAANELQRQTMPAYDAGASVARVDRLIAAFDAQWFANHTIASMLQPGFICGMFRSGSTLLEQMLSTHSAVTAGGELDFFISAARSIGQVPGERDDWSAVTLERLGNDYAKLLNSLGNADGRSGVARLNKRPDNLEHLGLIKTLFPAARILITRRQLAENCLSVFSYPLGKQQSYATAVADIAHYYHQMERLVAHWLELFPDSIEIIDYEELVSEPEATLARALRLFDAQLEAGLEKFYAGGYAARTASVWQVRKPLYTHALDRASDYREWLDEALKRV